MVQHPESSAALLHFMGRNGRKQAEMAGNRTADE
jgi:hypothetical protein